MKELGLKAGIEIHQQLEGKKLFCSCPTILRDDEPDFRVQRYLRAAAGESGEIDIAALQEQQKRKQFTYEGYYVTTCLIELDEQPPNELNSAALHTALQFSKLVKAQVSPVIQVMRKTVVDGSNTSGFQRTALIARNGIIETSAGTVRIENISLEEDACKIIAETAEEKVYRLDRLGIPLIEIGTAPDLKTPEQVQEAAKKIGYLLRSLAGIKRGLGTIRQDVNISITGGTRIEIKGAQDLRQLPLLVELEAKRQAELLKIRDELRRIKLHKFTTTDVTSLLLNSSSKVIQNTIKKNGKIRALALPGFAGYVGRELQPNYRLGTEFSGRAKTKAGVGGIFHSDELPNYGITEQEVKEIKNALKCMAKDAFILVADEEAKAQKALAAVYERAQEVLMGVPPEVRKANPDGTTSFLRPMPGASRMYPETDVPLIRPDVKNIKLPETLEEKMLRYQNKMGLSKDLAEFIAKSDKMPLFEELTKQYPQIKPAFIADVLTSMLLEMKRKYDCDPSAITEDQFHQLFQYLSEDKIHKDIILDVLIDMSKKTFDIQRYATLSTENLHQVIRKVIKENPNAPFGALMGKCVKELAGRASGQVISEELKKLLAKGHK